MNQESANTINGAIKAANHILVIQADNPDADSLGSALALEELLENAGKRTTMYCGVDVPGYLRYLEGWDRVTSEVPKDFDLSIIVDASTRTLLQKLNDAGELSIVESKPHIVIDHHTTVSENLSKALISVVDPNSASTGQLLFELANHLEWPVTALAAEAIMTSILGDTQGLSNDLTSATTYRTMAALVDAGANRPKLEELRREQSKMPAIITKYKGRLLQRATLKSGGQIASVTIPNDEIIQFSPLYNPGPLVLGDLLQTQDVQVAVIFKVYDSGRVTGSIRCNNGSAIANTLAEAYGGGGHPYAAGFKVNKSHDPSKLINEVLASAEELLRRED